MKINKITITHLNIVAGICQDRTLLNSCILYRKGRINVLFMSWAFFDLTKREFTFNNIEVNGK